MNAGLGNRRPRRGFTLVELLVVMTIIGILVALLLPGIQAARTDYAANAGTNHNIWWQAPGSGNPAFFDVPGFHPPDRSATADGVIFTLSMTTSADILDGESNTYLLGEKYLNPDHWLNGKEATDNNPLYAGFDWDWQRWCDNVPRQDHRGYSNYYVFGSAHAGGLNMVMCDGSGHWISYSIDEETHERLGGRKDRLPIDTSKAGW